MPDHPRINPIGMYVLDDAFDPGPGPIPNRSDAADHPSASIQQDENLPSTPAAFQFINCFATPSSTSSTTVTPPLQQPTGQWATREQRRTNALRALRDGHGRLTPINLLLYVLDENIPGNHKYRQGFLGDRLFEQEIGLGI